jgi:hypothetical protein
LAFKTRKSACLQKIIPLISLDISAFNFRGRACHGSLPGIRLSHPILPTSRTDALNSRARVMAGSRDTPHGLRREPSTTLQPSCPYRLG